ncbi:hypothetical protein HRbin16_00320 [bacterium HR16]|nr:hypothetical protein HRbin16_00320 [bacterium HR16]
MSRALTWLFFCVTCVLTAAYFFVSGKDVQTRRSLEESFVGWSTELIPRPVTASKGLPLHHILPYLHGVDPAEVERRPLLLVYSFGCTGCGEGSVEEWARLLAQEREVVGVIVVLDGKERIEELKRRKGWSIPVVADDGSIARILNPAFSPQAFGFARSRLVWVQQTPGVPEARLREDFYRALR